MGYSVATAGDINGDGYSDILVGAETGSLGQINEGRVFVYHGAAAGPSALAAIVLERNQGGATFGYSVASAGDVDGDGFSDVIIGAPFFDSGQSNEGRAFVYRGSASGLTQTPAGRPRAIRETPSTGSRSLRPETSTATGSRT
jgi:hypothetical protein